MKANKNIVSNILGFTKNHSPELLISAGVIGMVSSTVLAVKATPKAIRLMEDKKSELGVTYLTKKETIEVTWKQYAPSVALTILSAAGIIVGTTKNMKRSAALATVYALSENTLREYQRKTVEVVGKEKAAEIEREVAKAHLKDRPVFNQNDSSEYVANTGNGDQLMFDTLSGRYFRSSKNAVDSAVNYINKQLRTESTMSANAFYNELNIPTIGAGNYIGWNIDNNDLEVSYDSDIDKNGQAYVIISYYNRPILLKANVWYA